MFKSFRFLLGVLVGANIVGFAMSFDLMFLLTGKVVLPQAEGARNVDRARDSGRTWMRLANKAMEV
jgi:hypothetical protein